MHNIGVQKLSKGYGFLIQGYGKSEPFNDYSLKGTELY